MRTNESIKADQNGIYKYLMHKKRVVSPSWISENDFSFSNQPITLIGMKESRNEVNESMPVLSLGNVSKAPKQSKAIGSLTNVTNRQTCKPIQLKSSILSGLYGNKSKKN